MHRAFLIALALLAAPLAGCAQSDDTMDDEPEVAWENAPDDRRAGQAIDMSWTVDGPEGEIPHTGVHWAEESVESPTSPADYGNTSGAVEPAQVPGTFDTDVTLDEPGTYYFIAHAIVDEEHVWSEEVEVQVEEGDAVDTGIDVTLDAYPEEADPGEELTFEWSLSGVPDEADRTQLAWSAESTAEDPMPADYPNKEGTVEDASIPGSYDATFTVSDPGEYHARAHAVHDGSHYWSEEVTFEIQGDDTSGEHSIDIVSIAQGYEPAELTVSPGDVITWTNTDSLSHTVTFDEEALGDSGGIGAGETYELTVPSDIEPGTYEYYCDFHSTMPTASITVEA